MSIPQTAGFTAICFAVAYLWDALDVSYTWPESKADLAVWIFAKANETAWKQPCCLQLLQTSFITCHETKRTVALYVKLNCCWRMSLSLTLHPSWKICELCCSPLRSIADAERAKSRDVWPVRGSGGETPIIYLPCIVSTEKQTTEIVQFYSVMIGVKDVFASWLDRNI